MPETPNYGFEYETPQSKPGITLTGDMDGSAPILAEQVDTALAGIDSRLTGAESAIAALQAGVVHDTGWIALGVTPAGGYDLTTSLYRHWGPVVSIQIVLTRTGGNFTANTAGGVTDTTLCTVDTTTARPVNQTYTSIQMTLTSGSALINTNGTIVIADMHANSIIATDDVVRISTMYFVATTN